MTNERDDPTGSPSPAERACGRRGDVVDFDGQRVATGPCQDRDGRPLAHTTYVAPVTTNAALTWSLIGGGVLVTTMVALFFLGPPARPNGPSLTLRTALAPGPTSAPHALASTDCVQCHEPANNVEDVRCERCHDPAVSGRLSNAAHVFNGTQDILAAMSAPVVQCATCHVEHRGADVNLADVDDRECASCHRTGEWPWNRLKTLDDHPEFAVVRSAVDAGNGLRWFNHGLHLEKVQQKFQRGCEGCHEGGASAPAFQPISFARHCAACHDEDLSRGAGSLSPATIAALGPLPSVLQVEGDFDVPGRKVLVGFTHADPWILETVQSLRRTIDPGGVAAERLMLEREIAQLELSMRFAPRTAGAGAWLDAASQSSRDRQAPPTASPESALQDLATAIEAVGTAFGSEHPPVAVQPPPVAGSGTAQPDPSAASAAPTDATRRTLESVIARARAAGDASLEARAQALLRRLNSLPTNRTPTDPQAAAKGVELILSEVASIQEPASRERSRELVDLARLAQHRAAGGLDPTAFDQHRQQLLLLLDSVRESLRTIRNQGDPRAVSLLAREESLRRLVLATAYSTPAEGVAALTRFLRDRQLERTRVDLELEEADLRVAAPSEGEIAPGGYEDRLASLRGRLAAVGRARPLAAALPPADARAAIAALLGVPAPDAAANAAAKNKCTMCHELSHDGTQLAPVRAAGETLMPAARFTHTPHVSAAADNCETCHTSIRSSEFARDVNLPGVKLCATCHAPGRQAARASGCESCHDYHVPTVRALRWGT